MTSATNPLYAAIGDARLVRGADRLRRGHLRIETAFCLPDNSFVDVYLPDIDEAVTSGTLTDFGATIEWLLSAGVDPQVAALRAQLEGVMASLDVCLDGEELKTSFATLASLPDAIARLGQACSRIADLIFADGR